MFYILISVHPDKWLLCVICHDPACDETIVIVFFVTRASWIGNRIVQYGLLYGNLRRTVDSGLTR